LADESAGGPRLHSLLAHHGWLIETSRKMRTDLELLCCPGRGRFSTNTDCRVLAVFDESLFTRIDSRAAHVVLSPSGKTGSREQWRLKLDDAAGLWAL